MTKSSYTLHEILHAINCVDLDSIDVTDRQSRELVSAIFIAASRLDAHVEGETPPAIKEKITPQGDHCGLRRVSVKLKMALTHRPEALLSTSGFVSTILKAADSYLQIHNPTAAITVGNITVDRTNAPSTED